MSRDIARLNDTQIAVAIRRRLTDAESARHWHIMSLPTRRAAAALYAPSTVNINEKPTRYPSH